MVRAINLSIAAFFCIDPLDDPTQYATTLDAIPASVPSSSVTMSRWLAGTSSRMTSHSIAAESSGSTIKMPHSTGHAKRIDDAVSRPIVVMTSVSPRARSRVRRGTMTCVLATNTARSWITTRYAIS